MTEAWPTVARPADTRADKPGVELCSTASCRARIRKYWTVGGSEMPVNADPDPEGRVVWVKTEDRGWLLRVLKHNEQPAPGATRFTAHFATCTAPQEHRNRDIASRSATRERLRLIAATYPDSEEIPEQPPVRRRDHLRLVRDDDVFLDDQGQVLPELELLGADQDVEERTCGGCGAVCPAVLPHVSAAEMVLVDRTGGLYGLLAVWSDGRWRVRDVESLEREPGLPLEHRVRRHYCPDLSYRCVTPGHEDRPARRLAIGDAFCPDCLAAWEGAR